MRVAERQVADASLADLRHAGTLREQPGLREVPFFMPPPGPARHYPRLMRLVRPPGASPSIKRGDVGANPQRLGAWVGFAVAKHAGLFLVGAVALSLAHAIWPEDQILGWSGVVNADYLALAPIYWLIGLVPFGLFCLTPLAMLRGSAARWIALVALPPALFPALVLYESPATFLGLVLVDLGTLALTRRRRPRARQE